jgi:hypothetical protein
MPKYIGHTNFDKGRQFRHLSLVLSALYSHILIGLSEHPLWIIIISVVKYSGLGFTDYS